MIGGHLGSRVSALLDGQLGAEEAERAWTHVHQCPACRDLVEREGWVKTRLAGLSLGMTPAPASLTAHLKGGVRGLPPEPVDADTAYLAFAGHHRHRRTAGLVALGGGAVGAAVVGVLAFGGGPVDAPTDRRQPPANISQVTPSPAATLSPGGRSTP